MAIVRAEEALLSAQSHIQELYLPLIFDSA